MSRTLNFAGNNRIILSIKYITFATLPPMVARKKTKATGKGSKTPKARKSTRTSSQSRPRREFPIRSLEDALQVPTVIEEKNSGNPWASDQVAVACGTTKTNNKFFYLTAASRDYGLTEGARDSAQIALTDLGRAIVLPSSPNERQNGLKAAFHNIDLFRKVDEHYGNKELPEDKFFDSLVQKDFGLPKEYANEFRKVFKQNRDFLIREGITIRPAQGTRVTPLNVSLPQINSNIQVTVSTHDKTAFVIMPFSEKGDEPRPPGFFQEVLRNIITPAGDQAKFNIETALQAGSDMIQSTIIEHLIRADLVIADLTDHNPNVLFELGVRIALDKPVVLIRAKGTPSIFDVDNVMRVESYDPLLWVETVKRDVPKIARHIRDGWDKRSQNRRYMEILAGPTWHQS